MYALARELEYFDMPQIRAVVDGAAVNGYHLFDLVMGLVQSDAFRYQAQEVEVAASVEVAIAESGSSDN